MTVVLDASALLALLNDEPGCERVAEALDDAVIGVVNLAEVAAGLIAKGKSEVQARAALRALACDVVGADEELALDAGFLRRMTQSKGLSLADRFCLALARRLGAAALTADRNWTSVADAVGVEVILIR